MNDFHLKIGNFSHYILVCILKVVFVANKANLWWMILQALCLARLGNKPRGSDLKDLVIILAIYINATLQANQH